MKPNRNRLAIAAVAGAIAVSCAQQAPLPAAKSLADKLMWAAASRQIMYGHEDALLYGHSWSPEGARADGFDRSDVKEVCGDHPAVLGLDLGGIEMLANENLDNLYFNDIRDAAAAHYARGGIVTFSWHARNPLTGGDAWDVSSTQAVASVLEGGEKHRLFMDWLAAVGNFLESVTDAEGNPIPVIFRPWHEHTGSWFWWGRNLCTVKEYRALWQMTYDYLAVKRGMSNLLWAYSPNTGIDEEVYMERYPSDDFVDILGFDCYESRGKEESIESANARYEQQLREALTFISRLGSEHGKIVALTETGFEGTPDPAWWTEVLLPAVSDFPIAYLLTWRNAWNIPTHFYAPYKGAASEENFIKFYDSPKTLFLEDIQ